MQSKTVQIEFMTDGTAEVTYWIGDNVVKGAGKHFLTVPKRLQFFYDKFGTADFSDEHVQVEHKTDESSKMLTSGSDVVVKPSKP